MPLNIQKEMYLEGVNVGTSICLNRSVDQYFHLACQFNRQPANITWTAGPNNTVILKAPVQDYMAEINPDFFADGYKQLLKPGVLYPSPLRVFSSEYLAFTTHIHNNLTNPEILPNLPQRDREFIRNLVFDEILGNYTCLIENEYGYDMATSVVSECGEYKIDFL